MFTVKIVILLVTNMLYMSIISTLLIAIWSSSTVLAFDGDATYFEPGLGNCGSQSVSTDYIVALSTEEYNGGAHCYQQITVTYGDRSIDATVVDSCPGCSQYDVDLSPAAFESLASKDLGRIRVSWDYAGGGNSNEGGGDNSGDSGEQQDDGSENDADDNSK